MLKEGYAIQVKAPDGGWSRVAHVDFRDPGQADRYAKENYPGCVYRVVPCRFFGEGGNG